MYGLGILKGLGVTFKHFVDTYIADVRYAGRKYFNQDVFEKRQGLDTFGMFTVEYPDEKIAVPERFRFVPFLVTNDLDAPENPGEDWCTSCGICAKVCPPQCIWIVRGEDPVSKRPIPQPEAFYIDIDICMNCGFCAEFCPFDAIKMDHNYELASYDRTSNHIYDKPKLSRPLSYWKSIAPTTAVEEMMARGGWEHSDVIKEKKKAEQAAAKAAKAPTPAAVATSEPLSEKAAAVRATDQAEVSGSPAAAAVAEAVAPAAPAASAEDDAAKAAAERLAKREAALARKRANKDQGGD